MSRKTATNQTSGTKMAPKARNRKFAKVLGMKITSRVVNVRRHTTGYVADGKNYTVSQMRNMATKGHVEGIQVVGNHIQALPGQKRLTDLPTKVSKI